MLLEQRIFANAICFANEGKKFDFKIKKILPTSRQMFSNNIF